MNIERRLARRLVIAAGIPADVKALQKALETKPVLIKNILKLVEALSMDSLEMLNSKALLKVSSKLNSEICSKVKNRTDVPSRVGLAMVYLGHYGFDQAISDEDLKPYANLPFKGPKDTDDGVSGKMKIRREAISRFTKPADWGKYLHDGDRHLRHNAVNRASATVITEALFTAVKDKNDDLVDTYVRSLWQKHVKLDDEQIEILKKSNMEGAHRCLFHIMENPEAHAEDMLSSPSDGARKDAIEHLPARKLVDLFDSTNFKDLCAIASHVPAKYKPKLLSRMVANKIKFDVEGYATSKIFSDIFDKKLPSEAWMPMIKSVAEPLLGGDRHSSALKNIEDCLPDSDIPEFYQLCLKYDPQFDRTYDFFERFSEENLLDIWKKVKRKIKFNPKTEEQYSTPRSMARKLIENGPRQIAEDCLLDKQLAPAAKKRIQELGEKEKTQVLKETGHSIPTVAKATIEKLRAKFAELPEQDIYKWGMIQKHFEVPGMTKELKPTFEKLNQSGNVKRSALVAALESLAKEAKQFDVGFDTYGHVQTIGMAKETKVIQLNIGDALQADLAKRFTAIEIDHFKKFLKGLAQAQEAHPVVYGKTAAWARVVPMEKESILLVEELQSDLFNPMFLEQWLHFNAGHFKGLSDAHPFYENPDSEEGNSEDSAAARERMRRRNTQGDEGEHEDIEEEAARRMQQQLPDHVRAMKSSVNKVLGYFKDWSAAMMGAVRSYASSLGLKTILVVSSAVKEKAIRRHVAPHFRRSGDYERSYDEDEAKIPASRLQELYEKLPEVCGFKKIPIAKITTMSPMLSKRLKEMKLKGTYLWYAQTKTVKTARTQILAGRLRYMAIA